jgi:hypothetical protein
MAPNPPTPDDKPKPSKKSKPKVVDIQTKKIPPPPKPKVPSVLGSKARAGRLLSHHLRVIAQEDTELGPEGDMVTKAEALARTMFKLALGSKVVDKNGVEIISVPDRGMIALIWDRIEGRAAQTDTSDDKRMTLPKKVSAENKKRLNSLALGDNDLDAKLQAEPIDTLPEE